MAVNPSQSNPIQEGLKLMNECPLCKKQYVHGDQNVLKQQKGAHLIHMTCPYCHNAVLAMIVVTNFGLSSVGMVTDLNAQDALRLHQVEPVIEDELLNFHSFIKENNILKILN